MSRELGATIDVIKFSRSEMRNRKPMAAMAAVVLAACSSPTPKHVDDAETAEPELTAEGIVAAQAAGYTLVNKNGEQILCRRNAQTGSRLQHTTTCLTAREWTRMRNSSRKTLEDMTRGQRPPCDLDGSC
jgi:hypothetical protein